MLQHKTLAQFICMIVTAHHTYIGWISGSQTTQIATSHKGYHFLVGCNLHRYKGIRFKLAIFDRMTNETKHRLKPCLLPHVRRW